MLCHSPSYRHNSLGVTKERFLWLRLVSTSRVRSHRPKAVFGRKQGNSDQHHDDFLASSWDGEQPDWTEAPHQPDVLDEVWYEASTSGLSESPCLLAALFLAGAALCLRLQHMPRQLFLCRRMLPLKP